MICRSMDNCSEAWENRILDSQRTEFIAAVRPISPSRLAAPPELGNRRPGQLPAIRPGRRVN